VVKIAGSVNDTMYLDGPPTDDVEDKIGFNDQDTVAVLSKSWVSRYPTQQRLVLKFSDAFIKSANK
jgi:hypothetical protein